MRTHTRQTLSCAQGAQLREREIFGEPALVFDSVHDLGAAAVGKLFASGHIGCAADLVLVPDDQNTVGGGHDIGFHVVGAFGNCQFVCRSGVLGATAAKSAMSDDEW